MKIMPRSRPCADAGGQMAVMIHAAAEYKGQGSSL